MDNLQHELEFERKYLIKTPLDFELSQFPSKLIKQRYIDYNWVIQRLRSIDNSDYILTLKQKQKWVLGKVETEKTLTQDEFENLLQYAIPNKNGPIIKSRYDIAYGNSIIELDCYGEVFNYLMIAEVEFDSLADISTFIKPSRFWKEISWKVSNKKLYLKWTQALVDISKSNKKSDYHSSHKDIVSTHRQIKQTKVHLHKLKKQTQE